MIGNGSVSIVVCDSCTPHDRMIMKHQLGVSHLFYALAGIPDTFTGQPNFDIAKPADNCWVSPLNSSIIIQFLKEDTLND